MSRTLPWELGAIARAAGKAKNENPFAGALSRRAWLAGWEWEDREIREDGRETPKKP